MLKVRCLPASMSLIYGQSHTSLKLLYNVHDSFMYSIQDKWGNNYMSIYLVIADRIKGNVQGLEKPEKEKAESKGTRQARGEPDHLFYCWPKKEATERNSFRLSSGCSRLGIVNKGVLILLYLEKRTLYLFIEDSQGWINLNLSSINVSNGNN